MVSKNMSKGWVRWSGGAIQEEETEDRLGKAMDCGNYMESK
jgi:hypothetical protein